MRRSPAFVFGPVLRPPCRVQRVRPLRAALWHNRPGWRRSRAKQRLPGQCGPNLGPCGFPLRRRVCIGFTMYRVIRNLKCKYQLLIRRDYHFEWCQPYSPAHERPKYTKARINFFFVCRTSFTQRNLRERLTAGHPIGVCHVRHAGKCEFPD
jgi:hypothetical protein